MPDVWQVCSSVRHTINALKISKEDHSRDWEVLWGNKAEWHACGSLGHRGCVRAVLSLWPEQSSRDALDLKPEDTGGQTSESLGEELLVKSGVRRGLATSRNKKAGWYKWEWGGCEAGRVGRVGPLQGLTSTLPPVGRLWVVLSREWHDLIYMFL